MKKRVGVVFGGSSVEHEISIISALQAIENLDLEKYEVIPVYIDKKGIWYTDKRLVDIQIFREGISNLNLKPVRLVNENNRFYLIQTSKLRRHKVAELDIVFPIVHGTNVEDGKLQGYFETINIPYVGPSCLSANIGQDKAVMKDILKANNIDQIEYKWYYKEDVLDEIIKDITTKLGTKVIVKPAELGSSIGIGIANNEEELVDVLNEAFSFSTKVVVEKLCEDFKEVNISVLGDYSHQEVSLIEQVQKNDDILSYEDKYMSNSKTSKSGGMASLQRIIPAPLSDEENKKIEIIARNVFKVLNCQGIIRIDLMISKNVIFVNEVNNIPGSLSFYLWDDKGVTYSQLLDKMIELGINTYFKNKKINYTINTNVLNMKGMKSK